LGGVFDDRVRNRLRAATEATNTTAQASRSGVPGSSWLHEFVAARTEGASMAYQTFALKYRPQTFDEIVGQDHVSTTLKNAVSEGRVAHGYLFAGPRGTGKTSTAAYSPRP
jgi:predicted ATPase with chaperone activity